MPGRALPNEGIALPELSRRRRYLVLAICCLSLFTAAIILTARYLPGSRAGQYRRPDPFGQILWYEPRRADPLIELRFFRSLPFSGAA